MIYQNDTTEDDLMLKFFRKELTAEEKIRFKELLNSSTADRKKFNELLFIHEATDTLHLANSANISIASEKIKKRLKVSSRVVALKRVLLTMAAIFALPLVISSTYLYIKLQSEGNIAYNELYSLNGKVSLITLTDGSRVYLHSGSKLRYPNKFVNNQRLVELNGEGFFEVESNKERPFIVQSPDGAQVRALGTAFNVSAYSTDDKVTVFLARGSVDFTSSKLHGVVELKPGIELVYHKKQGTFEKSLKNAAQYTDWITGKLVFENASMQEVVKKLSKHYNLDIEIKDRRLNEYVFNATFQDETIYQVLNMLKKSSPCLTWELIQPKDSTIKRPKIDLTMKDWDRKY